MFNLQLLPRTELDCYYNETGRIYQTPDGDFPSVTTVLGSYFDNTALEEWKYRVGEKEAKRISDQAARNGTELHGVFEKFLLNEDYSNEHSIAKMRFASVKRKLENNIDDVYGVEFPLFSKELKTAGRADAVVKWKNKKSILDLKTTRKYKKEEWIDSYFTQATTYGIMINDMYELGIEQIVIVFSTDDLECYYFEKPISDFTSLVNKIFKENR